MNTLANAVAGRGVTHERRMHATVWSQPGLSSDMPQRRVDAKCGSAKLLAAILRAQGGGAE